MRLSHLSSLSFLILFNFQAVHSLMCYACADPQCKNTISTTCPAGNACLFAVFTVNNTEYHVRSCSPLEMCKQPPSFLPPGSTFSQSCCDTDRCNSAVTEKMSVFTAGFLALVSLYVSRF